MYFNGYQELLAQFISFKSISTDPEFQSEINKTVNWLVDFFKEHNFDTEIWQGKTCNPVIYASYNFNPELETVLVYGHYDVQPAHEEDGWKNDPFKLDIRKGRMYARGVVDNKGQIFTHMYIVARLIDQKKLKYNVIFLIEGNEETSNEDIAKMLYKHKSKLQADHVLISDGELLGNNPVIEYSLRGGFNCKLSFTTADNNLHSGIYGGAVPNAASELTFFLNKLIDKDYKIAIPGFYDDVDPITDDLLKVNKKIPHDLNKTKTMTGVSGFRFEENYDFYTQTGLRPTVEITGFKSGYINGGFSNIIPPEAEVKLNFRTVLSQNTDNIIDLFKKFVQDNVPGYVSYDLEFASQHNPVKVNINSSIVQKLREQLHQSYGETVVEKPVGGGIPVVADFKEVLGIDALLVSLGNEDCNMHGVNENFKVDLAKKGLRFSELFFSS